RRENEVNRVRRGLGKLTGGNQGSDLRPDLRIMNGGWRGRFVNLRGEILSVADLIPIDTVLLQIFHESTVTKHRREEAGEIVREPLPVPVRPPEEYGYLWTLAESPAAIGQLNGREVG